MLSSFILFGTQQLIELIENSVLNTEITPLLKICDYN